MVVFEYLFPSEELEMDLVCAEETRLVRSNEFRGSMAVHHQEVPEAIHAVEVDDDGRAAQTAVCGWAYPPARLASSRKFAEIVFTIKCKACLVALGDPEAAFL